MIMMIVFDFKLQLFISFFLIFYHISVRVSVWDDTHIQYVSIMSYLTVSSIHSIVMLTLGW